MAGGRKPHEPTEEQRKLVSDLAACGVTHDQIAKVTKIHKTTLRKYYRDELDFGSILANKEVANTLFAKATSPDLTGPSVTAAIFWLKTRARWRETNDLDITSSDGSLKSIAWKVVKAKDEDLEE